MLGRNACAIGHLLRKSAHRSAIHTRCVQIGCPRGRISTASHCAGSLYRPHRCLPMSRQGLLDGTPDCQWWPIPLLRITTLLPRNDRGR
ncbi:hypothetical protein STAFG_0063 [Streptomyces afghaniensis 772]|uniref:Uncharacterized protein n=1 Tax=Streptomyces afghaniensis 772 TaxID=1283301 RepID=S4N007_9ACTN|nr:hypothetical protein STAFG_0063 [Streptomyces afghaniensis 772]